MTLLSDASESKKFDVRVVERNINRGRVQPQEFQQAVQSLPDDSENAEWISIESLANDEEPTRNA